MSKYLELVSANAINIRDNTLDEMRKQDPIFKCNHQLINAWVVTRYEDVSSLFKDERLEFGSTKAEIIQRPFDEQEALSFLLNNSDYMLSTLPKDRHDILQQLYRQFFSAKSLKAFKTEIAKIVDKQISMVLDKNSDLVSNFAYQIPAKAIATIMGVRPEDQEKFVKWSTPLEALFWPYSFDKYLAANNALKEMTNYCKEHMVIAANRDQHNLLGMLGRAVQNEHITEEEASINAALTLFAGHETTATVISAGIDILTKHPKILEELESDPSLISNFTAELLRFSPAVGWMRRTVLQPFNYKGHAFVEGDIIFLGTYSANRDPDFTDNPNDFDLHRILKKPIMTFGAGRHYCLGALLAKLEIEISLGALIKVLRKIEIAEVSYTPTFMFMNTITNIHSSPIMLSLTEPS